MISDYKNIQKIYYSFFIYHFDILFLSPPIQTYLFEIKYSFKKIHIR